MPRGIYVRPKIRKTCLRCDEHYVLRRGGSDVCRRCRRQDYDRAYVQRTQPWKRPKSKEAQERKRASDRSSYRRNLKKRKAYRKRQYWANRDYYLKNAEKHRRARGEQPAGSHASGPEVMFMELLKAAGVEYQFRARIGPRVEVDFLLQGRALVVELQGEHHRTPYRGPTRFEQTLRSDERRRVACREQGLRLIEVPVYGAFRPALKAKTVRELRRALSKVTRVRVRPDKTPEMCVWKEPT